MFHTPDIVMLIIENKGWIMCFIFEISLYDVFKCIFRPGRLTDGPYTSYDLNTLLKATAGQRRAVLIGQGI